METEYHKLYDLENYLFKEVSIRFAEFGYLNAFDFFCIVIWKANRSKSKIARRILSHGYPNLESAVVALTKSLANAADDKSRMKALIIDWGFKLPMASAILTVLYPVSFTVYDFRVCEALGGFFNMQNKSNFDSLWNEYESFVAAVNKAAPSEYSLRDKDRWLWGHSFYQQLQENISEKFQKKVGD
ncbi:MAG: hypothetical protein NTW80_08780 [Deltaproteobacteria bacterium]|nr:hypothetical protein [Deltaproteobacteria bacterium]